MGISVEWMCGMGGRYCATGQGLEEGRGGHPYSVLLLGG